MSSEKNVERCFDRSHCQPCMELQHQVDNIGKGLEKLEELVTGNNGKDPFNLVDKICRIEKKVETHDRFQFIPCDAMEQRVQKLERLAAYPSTPFQINTSSDILTIHKLQQEKSVLQETVVEGKLSYERLSEENKTLKATVDEQRDELYRVKTIVIAAKDNLSGL